MPGFNVTEISVLNQIKSNLQDRYETGFPILKELLQNADDSGAETICCDFLPGWPGAKNPLLRGAGLMVINDGEFRDEDQRGITSFGESGKTTDTAAIGKFGFGQKSVFHLCDAFIIRPEGTQARLSLVVNPFVGVRVDGNVSGDWEALEDGDLTLLSAAADRAGFGTKRLILWLPFRRRDLAPAPNAGFSNEIPDGRVLLRQFDEPEALRATLACLRRLRTVELRNEGQIELGLSVDRRASRLLGPKEWREGVREFAGQLELVPKIGAKPSRYIGREAMRATDMLNDLRSSSDWPTTISVLHPTPQPEKGEPHGAATLVHSADDERSDLRILWAVFLPTSDEMEIKIDLAPGQGRFTLLLHGYFFLDSGRRRIEAIEALGAPSGLPQLRQRWNVELRNQVTLPLIPQLLHDALGAKVLSDHNLAALAAALRQSDWFARHRDAICQTDHLVRVLDASGVIAWRSLAADAKIRSLPKSLLEAPTRLVEMFPTIHEWADDRGVVLCVDQDSALSTAAMDWTADELGELMNGLSSKAFVSRSATESLAAFLDGAVQSQATRLVVGPPLVAALRGALQGQASLASVESICGVLRHVPASLVFPLPPAVEHRTILRALANAQSDVLPIRATFANEGIAAPRLMDESVGRLLAALESLIIDDDDTDLADEAAPAALAILLSAQSSLRHLAQRDDLARLKVLRAVDVRTRKTRAISLHDLVACSSRGLLFSQSPQANTLLPKLAAAILDADPLLLEARTAAFLRDGGADDLKVVQANRDAAITVVKSALRFGDDAARAALLDTLRPTEQDDAAPFRSLCAGDPNAGLYGATLFQLDGLPSALEPVVARVLLEKGASFLVADTVAQVLAPKQKSQLRIQSLDAAILERELESRRDLIGRMDLSEETREAFLLVPFSEHLLRRLPIHTRSDGSVGAIGDLVFREMDWKIPSALSGVVLTVTLAANPQARRRQVDIVPPWDAPAQLRVAMSQAEPHGNWSTILDALLEMSRTRAVDIISAQVSATPWLTVGSTPVCCADILALPEAVDQQARRVLFSDQRAAPFYTRSELPVAIKEHPGFKALQQYVLAGPTESLKLLTIMVADAGLVGRLGDLDDRLSKDLRRLAIAGADLKLPGWPLLASILADQDLEESLLAECIASFSNATDPKACAVYMDALAGVAELGGAAGEAARRLYRNGFVAIAAFSQSRREAVFGDTRVLTKSGGWRLGCDVAESGEGISADHVLSADYCMLLKGVGGPEGQSAPRVITPAVGLSNAAIDPSNRDFSDLEAMWATQHRQYLEPLRGRVPGELPIVYLGLIGRHAAIAAVAETWAGEATATVETLWAGLDQALDPTLPNGVCLSDEIEDLRFEVVVVEGDHVVAHALNGAEFAAPLGGTWEGLVVGNAHLRGKPIASKDGRRTTLITLSLRPMSEAGLDHEAAKQSLAGLIEAVGVDCLRLIMSNQMSALRDVLDKGKKVDQATIEETRLELEDRLPTILAQLKLPVNSRAHRALRAFQAAESQTHRLQAGGAEGAGRLQALKQELWSRLADDEVAAELLAAIRAKISELGYSPERVLFELFQNADDAYGQQDPVVAQAKFQVDVSSIDQGGFRTVHWGRTINHLGRDLEGARDLGHARDLLNMLVMNFSDKRADEDLTGKFGLGFKSVHVLSDNVGVASGFISLRVRGGLLPASWTEGLAEVEARRSPTGEKATLVDVPFTLDTATQGLAAIQAFRAAVQWLPAFSRHVRRIEINADHPLVAECSVTPLMGSGALHVIGLQGDTSHRALRLDLGHRFSLFIGLDDAGPKGLPSDLRRLWNLAPLEEEVASGWILNGPFAVDPGRGRLSGTVEARQDRFKTLGRALGQRLLELFDLSQSDWPGFAQALGLESAGQARSRFWRCLYETLRTDVDDHLAGLLHVDGQGYARLTAERPAAPTGLPPPFPDLVQSNEIEHYLDGGLTHLEVLAKVGDWPGLQALRLRVVSRETAEVLRRLGAVEATPLLLSNVVGVELAAERRLEPSMAQRLGAVISPETIEGPTLLVERAGLLAVLRQAEFRASDDTWRASQGLNMADADGGEEQLISRFAPAGAVLHPAYVNEALALFKVARRESGYGPRPAQLLEWAGAADTSAKRQAALRYVIDGGQGRAFGQELRSNPPSWLPQPLDTLAQSPLLAAWTLEDKNRLIAELVGFERFSLDVNTWSNPTPARPDGARLFGEIQKWWSAEGAGLAAAYSASLYPTEFSVTRLTEADDRQAWFTMFALACFQTIGRTQEGQHRAFIASGLRDGWWGELAESRPPNDMQAWISRLENWSGALVLDQQFMSWRRVFVDLYTFARWLDDYILIMRKLPRVVEERGVVSLQDILQPSFSPAIASLSIDAAPINRSLGIGVNWMIREFLRGGIYTKDDRDLMAPYSFASTERVRLRVLQPIGYEPLLGANSDESRNIHSFLETATGREGLRFQGDYDLPLQLITRSEHQEALIACFEAAGGVPDDLEDLLSEDDVQDWGQGT